MAPEARVEDREALFQKALTEFGPALVRLARSYEQEAAKAEDLYQEICLAVWQALPQWRGDASLRTFVYRIAHNRSLTHGWREGKRQGSVPLQDAVETPDRPPAPKSASTSGSGGMPWKQRCGPCRWASNKW